jgi:vacuolar-type H+-ATPase subunit C/Vma6
MSAWKYKQLTPKVIASKLRLINKKDLTDLCGRTLEAVSLELSKTPYKQDIARIPTARLDSLSLERAFFRNFERTCREIIDCAPRGVKRLLSAVQTKFEANVAKTMLRARAANISIDEAMSYVIPAGRLDEASCRSKLGNSKNIVELIETFSGLEYGEVLKNSLTEYEITGALQTLEAAVDKHVYSRIWEAVGKLMGLDRKISRTVLGIEIDSVNAKVVLRGKALNFHDDQIKRLLVPSSDVFEAKDWENAIRSGDVKSAIESLLSAARSSLARDHQYVLNDALKEYEHSKSLSRLETVLDLGLLKTSLRMVRRYTYFFNVGSALAFLNLKWFEARNLRAIARGAEAKIPSSEIRKLLILPD